MIKQDGAHILQPALDFLHVQLDCCRFVDGKRLKYQFRAADVCALFRSIRSRLFLSQSIIGKRLTLTLYSIERRSFTFYWTVSSNLSEINRFRSVLTSLSVSNFSSVAVSAEIGTFNHNCMQLPFITHSRPAAYDIEID